MAPTPRRGRVGHVGHRWSHMWRDAKLAELSFVPDFQDCSARELQWLAQAGDFVDIPAGDCLQRGGATVRQIHFIIAGEVKMTGGTRRTSEPATSTSIVAVTEVRSFVIERRTFNGVREAHPALGAVLASPSVPVRPLRTHPQLGG